MAMALAGPAAAATTYSLAVSTKPDRSGAVPLAGKVFVKPASIYVLATPSTGAKRVRFYLDDTTMSLAPRLIDSTAPFDFAGTASNGSATALDVGTLSTGAHTITAAVETKTGAPRVLSASFTVTAPAAPPPGATPAQFPSRLKAFGRSIVDENGYVLPSLKGFNMHINPGFVWAQSHFDTVAALGAKISRTVLVWDEFEPTQGVISAAGIANLDLHIARTQAAGMYTLLELHLNVERVPSWTSDVTGETEAYAAHGQTLTRYLADRYGNPASPQYTKAVIGFGLNEPPLESAIRNGDGAIPWIEDKQRQMISWMRSAAPDWIGFVAYGYASATPIHDDAKQNVEAIDASATAYDAVGGNVVIDVHDYMSGCTNTDPNCDGRQWNGNIYPTFQGGSMISTAGAADYASSALRQSQQAAYLKPYKTFSTQAQIPLMLGEWGWPAGPTGESEWIADKKAAWTDAGTVIQIHWNYGVLSHQGIWVARPEGVWRPSVTDWMSPGA